MLLPSRILRDVSATGCAHVMLIYDEPLLSQSPLSGHFNGTLSGLSLNGSSTVTYHAIIQYSGFVYCF